MKAIRFLLIVLLVPFGCLSSASAGLIVSVGDLTLPAGGTGFVDVNIRSDSSDLLQFFGFEFRIEPVGFPGTRLEFTDPQPDPQLTDPAYVFFEDSAAESFGFPVGNVIQTSAPRDTFIGGDFTASGDDVTVGGTELLLARLEVTAATALAPNPGDQFTVRLISESLFSFFSDSQGNQLTFDTTPGTVTIASPTATVIPEPASITLLGLGAVGMGIAAARRRRTRATGGHRQDHGRDLEA